MERRFEYVSSYCFFVSSVLVGVVAIFFHGLYCTLAMHVQIRGTDCTVSPRSPQRPIYYFYSTMAIRTEYIEAFFPVAGAVLLDGYALGLNKPSRENINIGASRHLLVKKSCAMNCNLSPLFESSGTSAPWMTMGKSCTTYSISGSCRAMSVATVPRPPIRN